MVVVTLHYRHPFNTINIKTPILPAPHNNNRTRADAFFHLFLILNVADVSAQAQSYIIRRQIDNLGYL
jgi:hypothetical protein